MSGASQLISTTHRVVLALIVGSAALASTIIASGWAFWSLEGGESGVPALLLATGVPFSTPLFLRAFLPGGWSPIKAGTAALIGFAVWWCAAWLYLGPRFGPSPLSFSLVFPLTALGAFVA